MSDANRLAAPSLARGDATGWFDELYREACDGTATVPWDRGAPSPYLVARVGERRFTGRAVVVGAGFGHDAEFIASLGPATTAFDISPAAVARAVALHPDSSVDYVTADLLALPAGWLGAFDLVVENITVQALPPALHATATDAVASLVAPGGTLVAVGMLGSNDVEADGPPWPLTPGEIDRFAAGPLTEVRRDEPAPGRWLVELERS